jgi:hypothetical protein
MDTQAKKRNHDKTTGFLKKRGAFPAFFMEKFPVYRRKFWAIRVSQAPGSHPNSVSASSVMARRMLINQSSSLREKLLKT